MQDISSISLLDSLPSSEYWTCSHIYIVPRPSWFREKNKIKKHYLYFCCSFRGATSCKPSQIQEDCINWWSCLSHINEEPPPLPIPTLFIPNFSKEYWAPSTCTWKSCLALPRALLAVHWYVPSSAAVTLSIFRVFPKFSVSGSSLGMFPVTLTQLRWGVGLRTKEKKRRFWIEHKKLLWCSHGRAAGVTPRVWGGVFRGFWALKTENFGASWGL